VPSKQLFLKIHNKNKLNTMYAGVPHLMLCTSSYKPILLAKPKSAIFMILLCSKTFPSLRSR